LRQEDAQAKKVDNKFPNLQCRTRFEAIFGVLLLARCLDSQCLGVFVPSAESKKVQVTRVKEEHSLSSRRSFMMNGFIACCAMFD
jgi:hypothetical protein